MNCVDPLTRLLRPLISEVVIAKRKKSAANSSTLHFELYSS